MELTKEDHEALEIAVGRVLRRIANRRTDITRALYHAERQDMTDDEYAKAEKAVERKRDAAEDWE